MNLGADIPFNQTDPLNLAGPASARPRASPAQSMKKRLSEMTERERRGIPGLIAKLDPDHPDYSWMRAGIDPNELGLDLNRPP
jgi:hypothetical protein